MVTTPSDEAETLSDNIETPSSEVEAPSDVVETPSKTVGPGTESKFFPFCWKKIRHFTYLRHKCVAFSTELSNFSHFFDPFANRTNVIVNRDALGIK